MQLAVADVDADDLRRAVLQQHVGEAAGALAEVERSGGRRTAMPQRASAASSFSPPRETKRSSASSVTSSSQSSGSSSPALRGTAQPAGARQRTPRCAISRCAAERVGARPRATIS